VTDMFAVPQESDSLTGLEERIQRAVQLVAKLRQEKEAAVAEAAQARAEAAEVRSEADRLAEEVQGLQAERKQVRNRIERLLGQIDELNAG
jgi:FtsZ-binding cell division protein ZapB